MSKSKSSFSLFKDNIITHDIEAAAFVIVSVSLLATLTSYALETSHPSVPVTTRDPVAVTIHDVNGDGINDIVLVHRNGSREVVITNNQ